MAAIKMSSDRSPFVVCFARASSKTQSKRVGWSLIGVTARNYYRANNIQHAVASETCSDSRAREFSGNEPGHDRTTFTHSTTRSEEHTSELQSLRHLVC